MKRVLIALSAVVALAAPAVSFADQFHGPEHHDNRPAQMAMRHHKHAPKGTDAICRDGSYSAAGHHNPRNCQGHGGVARWW